MSAQNGRDLRIKRGGVVLAIINTKTLTVNNAEIDITGDNHKGFITVLNRPGSRRLTIDASGITDSHTLRDSAVNATNLITDLVIEFLDNADLNSPAVIYSITGDFNLSAYSETGGTAGALEFSATFASSGAYAGSVPTPP